MLAENLGHYRILRPLGKGGMGEVYAAQDTKLGRRVALKVLPQTLAGDPARRERFEREARTVAALNHPQIVTIHSVEEADGVPFLTMELIEGLRLTELIPPQGMALDRLLQLAVPLADAVSAAHKRGIVHRDLKPANVMVTEEGQLKVLDFGLAKLKEAAASGEELGSEVATWEQTGEGRIVGTAAYMSPEQAEGKPVDARSDVFSLGIVLYEMTTGRRPFQGDSAAGTLSSILKDTPVSVSELRPELPSEVGRIIRRCLEKDPSRRMQTALDLRNELEDLKKDSDSGQALRSAPVLAQPAPRASWARRRLWVGAATGVVALGGYAAWRLQPWEQVLRPTAGPLRRFTVSVAPADSLVLTSPPSIALAPDGSRLVFVGNRGNASGLYSRGFDRLEADPIPGTEGARGPFFSPDGQWLGFYQGGKLKKLSARDGVPFALCSLARSWRGAGWSAGGAIFFSPSFRYGLWKVSTQGGTAEKLTTPNPGRGEKTHRWPEPLPGGNAILFTTGTASLDSFDEARIEALLLPSGERRVLVDGGMYARYAASEHLVYARDDALFAVSFDRLGFKVRGDPAKVLEDVMTFPEDGSAQYSLSRDGTLVYARGHARDRASKLVSVDRKGRTATLLTEPRRFWAVRISPEGNRVLTAIDGANSFVWVYDMSRGTLSRLTFEWDCISPIWTPDGRRVTFAWSRERANTNIYWQPADGSGPSEQLTSGEDEQYPGSWSPDGKTLAFQQHADASGWDVWLLSLEEGRVSAPLLSEAFNETSPMVSPDGRWLAYVSDETGRGEVYLRPCRRSGGKLQISTGGGIDPIWARDSSEVFYRNDDRIMSVALADPPGLRAATPRVLFEGSYGAFDVAPDGRFVMVEEKREPTLTHLEVVLNWFEELKVRIPAGR